MTVKLNTPPEMVHRSTECNIYYFFTKLNKLQNEASFILV